MEECRVLTRYDEQKVMIYYRTDECPPSATEVELSVNITGLGGGEAVKVPVTGGKVTLSLSYLISSEPEFWHEFSPKLYEAQLTVSFLSEGEKLCEKKLTKKFGFCLMETVGTQFSVNGKITFLRALQIRPEAVSQYTEDDWIAYLGELKERGLNCVSLNGDILSEELLGAADFCGMYVKVANTENPAKDESLLVDRFGDHPSLVMISGTGKNVLSERKVALDAWAEFAVRDRLDYSEAPDTRSTHIADIRRNDCPTLVTNVGELRNPQAEMSPGQVYLAQICTREAMEEALRTPKFGGFCLGMDAYVMELPERRMCEFSGPVVPLLKMKKYVWSSDEIFKADMLIANYGQRKLFERISVSAYDEHGGHYGVTSNKLRINRGGVTSVGQIKIPLEQFSAGQRLELTVSIDNTGYRNHYAIWMFDDHIPLQVPEHVHICRKLDTRMKSLLADGKKVVYIPKLNTLSVEPGWFSPLASQVYLNRERVACGGISCDPNHPVLRGFPTEESADFQWWHLIHNSIPVNLPEKLKDGVIVSMPAGSDGKQERALIFETRIGGGQLLVCAIDLLIQLDRPEARQLYSGILSYVASGAFSPASSMNIEELISL